MKIWCDGAPQTIGNTYRLIHDTVNRHKDTISRHKKIANGAAFGFRTQNAKIEAQRACSNMARGNLDREKVVEIGRSLEVAVKLRSNWVGVHFFECMGIRKSDCPKKLRLRNLEETDVAAKIDNPRAIDIRPPHAVLHFKMFGFHGVPEQARRGERSGKCDHLVLPCDTYVLQRLQ